MYNFNNIQEALNHIFDGYNISTIRIPGTPHPWFLVDQIRVAVGFNHDNYDFTKYMEHRDEYLAVLTLPEIAANFASDKLSEANNPAGRGGIRQFMIVSLPGLFELLRHINAKTSPRVSDFWYWLNNTILPELYYSPEIAEELVNRSKKRMYHLLHKDSPEHRILKENRRLAVDNSNMIGMINYLEDTIDRINHYGDIDLDNYDESIDYSEF